VHVMGSCRQFILEKQINVRFCLIMPIFMINKIYILVIRQRECKRGLNLNEVNADGVHGIVHMKSLLYTINVQNFL